MVGKAIAVPARKIFGIDPASAARTFAKLAPWWVLLQRADLVLGYHKANTSSLFKLFLSRSDVLTERVS
jgi:hypothetical protein